VTALPKVRQQVGKYRIDRRLARGGFAAVYRAYDTIEGLPVALKIPFPDQLTPSALENVKREVRLTARLEHRHICPVKNAELVDGLFIIASPLGTETLEDRLGRRLAPATALAFSEQLLEAVAHAHARRLIHCDIKPDNVILFPGPTVRLTDFGIAKVALFTRTLEASISGTIGYLAPEQALGRPSPRSDVFSTGLVVYRMFAGTLPTWPYDWPPEGYDRLKRVLRPPMIEVLRRAIQVDDRKRFRDASAMLAAFRKAKHQALRESVPVRRKPLPKPGSLGWKTVRFKEFSRRYGRGLGARFGCPSCKGPVSAAMSHCPWCGKARGVHREAVAFPKRCKRCGRGLKSDWRFCAWCYGGQVGPARARVYGDRRYVARCGSCREPLMAFSRYCPWCRAKVRKCWALPEGSTPCGGCGWGLLPDFWDHCPWCGKSARRKA
jgi:eukaryotic-like serine/threonine-protein kinase